MQSDESGFYPELHPIFGGLLASGNMLGGSGGYIKFTEAIDGRSSLD